MKIGIMQPYFFPYLGYFDLVNRTDRWVVFDTVKYQRKSWMNRNRILHPLRGWQYMTVPVSVPPAGSAVKDALLVDKSAAHRRILGQLEHYRKWRAPFFEAARHVVDNCFTQTKSDSLCELNVRSIAGACAYLGIRFEPVLLSTADLRLPEITKPGDWALEIASAMNASEYINLPGGHQLFDRDAFDLRGITLSFVEPMQFCSAGSPESRAENLSIVDVMMWNAPETIRSFLAARAAI